MSTRGGGRGGGRGRRGGGDFPHRGGGRAGGDGGRGGGGRERGGGGGRGGGGRERGGGGGGDQHFVPPPRREPPPIAYSQPAPPVSPRDLASSSSTVPSPKALSKEVEKMTIGGDKKEEPLAVTGKPTDELAPPVPSSSKALTHPRRPGYGTVGMKCVVRANHFLVEVANRDLFHYDVAITPEVTSRSVCRSIITQLVDLYKESHLGRLSPAYDGRKSLYTAAELPFTSKTFKIKLTERNRERDFDITIKLAGRADLHHLEQFLQGRHLDTPQETIQVLDIVLREFPSQNYVTVARSFFSKEFGHTRDIGDGLECWRGYYQSLRPTQMGLSLNIDISATSFYKPMAVLDFAAEYLRLRDITRPLTEKQCVGIKKALRGLRVEVIHRGDYCRRYKITGITNEPLSRLSFEDDKGMNVRVLDYFQDKYQYNLRHANWPCLQCGSDKRPTYLPMEVCKIVDGQRFSKKLNDQQVTEILRATCQRPQDRERSIIGMVRQNDYKNDKYAKEFGIQVRAELTSIEARVLPPPMLKYHETGREKICSPRVGAWNMINKKMVNGGNIQFWACISFSRNLHQDGVYNFCHSLFGTCNNIGMNVSANPIIDILFENFQNVERALRNAHSQADKALGGRPLQLLLIILPEISGSYGMIKRVCETELGIVSQCCLPKHAQQCKPQYMENVALKINVKVGGRNTVLADFVNNRVIPLVTDRPTIFFGADVTHPPPGEDSSSSIAAVVASMDWPQITNYKGLVSAQPHRQEMIKDLYTVTQDPQRGPVSSGMVRELLVSFYKKTNRKPDRIIFYRDGVSEGQFSHVLLYEMDAIRKACRSIQEGYLPPVTFVVVQKRHHTRLFPDVNSKQTDRSGNILPGTVVDTRICHPTEFDFYLCSHAGIQGTSRPTHYHVLYDENGFSADGLQILTNNLCYTYARCTRSVSVVPPAYYAHLLAFRARYYAEGYSEGESSVSGMRMRTTEVKLLPRIKDNVKEVMFYC